MFHILYKIILISTLLLPFGSGANANKIIEECSGCHTKNRNLATDHFSNGFSKWQDAQCFGCHNEISDIAKKFVSGVKDKRYFSLPVGDKKLKQIGHHPLSYLDAPLYPIKRKGKVNRYSLNSLKKYLKRPFGKCDHQGNCQAPTMMVYPKIKKNELKVFMDWLSSDQPQPQHKKFEKINAGHLTFKNKCSGCHSSSEISGYNTVGLSLFSKDWIFNYANKLLNTNFDKRKMPKVSINTNEAKNLSDYFSQKRHEQEVKLNDSLKEIPQLFVQDKEAPLSQSESFYLWKRLWRDNSCVHCHEIEGRANSVFDTSEKGITTWLKTNNPMDIYTRLITRKKETQFGIGAIKPGMPMTKAPVPEQVTSLISRWIKNGCMNLKKEALCKQKFN